MELRGIKTIQMEKREVKIVIQFLQRKGRYIIHWREHLVRIGCCAAKQG
jgi:hypothetical protein